MRVIIKGIQDHLNTHVTGNESDVHVRLHNCINTTFNQSPHSIVNHITSSLGCQQVLPIKSILKNSLRQAHHEILKLLDLHFICMSYVRYIAPVQFTVCFNILGFLDRPLI